MSQRHAVKKVKAQSYLCAYRVIGARILGELVEPTRLQRDYARAVLCDALNLH